MFNTASFHIVKPCNMSCKYCYATFTDFRVGKQITLNEAQIVVKKLFDAGLEKITFAGGEPLLYKNLPELIKYSKQIGLTTSIITNGSLLTGEFIEQMRPYLDWIGLSIDSVNPETNKKIGRVSRKHGDIYSLEDSYNVLVSLIKSAGYKLKINTVVNKYNQHENMQGFINWANPDRWKVFDTLRVKEQNDKFWEEIKSTEFESFVNRHDHKNMIVENNDLMTSSYLLIDPLGRMFENTNGKHTYSDSLIHNSVNHCLAQVTLDLEKFIERGGIYDWGNTRKYRKTVGVMPD